jgi:Zn-finger nucleic acid-binding protein
VETIRAAAGAPGQAPYRAPGARDEADVAPAVERKERASSPASTVAREDADDAPCPRCARALAPSDRAGTFGCGACGGLFVERTVLAQMTAEAEGTPPADAPRPHAGAKLDDVRYLPCPVCTQRMNRANFGRRSGVIVDVCKPHGTWFDAGEIDRALDFVARGGLAEAKRRAAEDAHERERDERVARHAAELRAALALEGAAEARAWGRGAAEATTLLEVLGGLMRDDY